MNSTLRKFSSYFLVSLVLISTVVAVLEIWGIHILEIEEVFWRLIKSLILILCSASVVLFIFAVLLKEKQE
jgi:hypothetical protein|tara:strand:+ start:125 stop:337 length:213 start_codon:yes stop_codon:yes gene_type:complete